VPTPDPDRIGHETAVVDVAAAFEVVIALRAATIA
jgi:hypothetical protein